MLTIDLNKEDSLATVQPESTLSEKDFDTVSSVIDSYLEEYGKLNGLIIYTKDFPGWNSFSAMLKHFKFVKDHQNKLSHVAIVTDSAIGNLVEKIAGHFISAEVKHFPYSQVVDAKSWILGTETV